MQRGASGSLLADANSCSPAEAIAAGRMLEVHGVCRFEEPCPYWELEWTAQVAAALDVSVAGGEQDNDLAQWRRMVAMPAVDIVQPDVCYVGGLTRALRVAALAVERGMACVLHSANLPLVTVFTLHLLGASPNAGPCLEYSVAPNDWVEGLYEPIPCVVDGAVAIPDGPGWGVVVDRGRLRSAEREVSRVR